MADNMAIREIERILSCDENGRATVEKAKEDANKLLAGADEELKERKQEALREIEEFKREEISKILQDASAKAMEVEKEAKAYCNGLERRLKELQEELVSEFLIRFYQEAGVDTKAFDTP